MKMRWRLIGSWEVCCWLARIISGRSQQVRVNRGVEMGSVAMEQFRKDHPVSAVDFSQVRLTREMIRL